LAGLLRWAGLFRLIGLFRLVLQVAAPLVSAHRRGQARQGDGPGRIDGVWQREAVR
jgi:hypothetical protein